MSAMGQIKVKNIPSSCKTTEYYDSTDLLCKTCPTNMIPTSDQSSCECNRGFYIDSVTVGDFFPGCLACNDTMGATQDKSRCLPCSGNATYDSTYKDCICPTNQYVVEYFNNGTFLEGKSCNACSTDSFPGPNNRPIYSCDVCGYEGQVYTPTTIPWTCACVTTLYTSSYGQCLINTDVQQVKNNYPLENARTINYDYVETGSEALGQVTVVISDTYNYLYYDAAVGCQEYGDPLKCQVLANLCVLQLYNERSIVCTLFKNIVNTLSSTQANSYYLDNGWKVGFPWLYYQRSSGEVLNQAKRVKFRVSFGFENAKIGILNKMTYVIAKFGLEGTFYGFETLTDQLLICQTSTEEVERLMKFGTTIQNSCTFDLSKLTSSSSFDHPRTQNMFYELYIQDYNGDLIDVPVMVQNMQDASGTRPNSDSSSSESGWRLTRRFFLFDTKSGVEGTDKYKTGEISTVVRYPKTMTLRIKLDPVNEEMIFTPLLIIDYRERSKTGVASNSLASVSFTMLYQMETTAFWNTTKGLLIGAMVLFGIIVFGQVCIWSLLPQLSDDQTAKCKYAIVKFFIVTLNIFSNLFFWFLVILSGYWFVFFKMQERVFCLLPDLNSATVNYKPFDILFACVISTKLVTIVYKIIFEQCSFDIFLVDWERPKLRTGLQNGEQYGVNAWRSLLLLNEFNELQKHKMISVEFTLITYAFFMEGLGWRYFSTHNPDFTLKKFNSPENYVLNFFVTAIVIYVIGIAQYVVQYLLKFKIPLKIEEFTDLCSICNVSVLMFDSEFHGYYIHGRSPYGQSEVTSENLIKALEYERTGKAQQRGLTPDDPGLQTFEIYMPQKMLMYYKDLYYKEINQEISNVMNTKQNRFNSVQTVLTREKALPAGFNINKLQDPGNFMNRLMQTYIEQVRVEPKEFVRDRGAFSRWLGLQPKLKDQEVPILFKDKWMSFSNFLLCGLDFDFLMLDVLVVSFIDLVAQTEVSLKSRLILGILIAYIVDQGLIFLRSYYGRRNLAKHTLADERFLV